MCRVTCLIGVCVLRTRSIHVITVDRSIIIAKPPLSCFCTKMRSGKIGQGVHLVEWDVLHVTHGRECTHLVQAGFLPNDFRVVADFFAISCRVAVHTKATRSK